MIHDVIVFVLGCAAGGIAAVLVYRNNLKAAQAMIATLKAKV